MAHASSQLLAGSVGACCPVTQPPGDREGGLGGSDAHRNQWPVLLEKGAHSGLTSFGFLNGLAS